MTSSHYLRRRDAPKVAGELECVECGGESDSLARGWLALRCEDPEKNDPPEIAFYCPICTWAEFRIDLRRRPRAD
jgi:hypothetical protein